MDAKNVVPKDPRKQVKELIAQMRSVLGEGELELRNMAYAHVYVDSANAAEIARGISYRSVAVGSGLERDRDCGVADGSPHRDQRYRQQARRNAKAIATIVDDTVYCPGAGGTIEQALKRMQRQHDG